MQAVPRPAAAQTVTQTVCCPRSRERRLSSSGHRSRFDSNRMRLLNSGNIKPKILFVVTEDWFFLTHRLALAKYVRDLGFDVFVATSPGRLRQSIEKEGLIFVPLLLRRNSKNPFHELMSILELTALYRRIRPDLVHHVALKPVMYGSIAAKFARRPGVVNAVTGLGYTFVGGSLRKRLMRKFLEFGCIFALSGSRSRVIFQNPDDRDLFTRKGLVESSRCSLILGAGVDTRRFSPSPEPPGTPVILFPSRMIWEKGPGEVAAAARILKRRGIDFRVVLAGRIDFGNPSSISEGQLNRWRDEGVADWLGHVDDMPGLYASSHIVCLPTYYREGIPLALIEAASSGRPVVTTDSPGCREIVRHNVNGLLIPPRDTQALADALQMLLENASLRKEMGRSGREICCRSFAKETVIRQTVEVYKAALDGKWPASFVSPRRLHSVPNI